MKRIFHILILLMLSLPAASQADSARFAALGSKLSEYYDALKRESIDVQKGECDFLIESASDSLIRQYVATDIYRHYLESNIMGSENVAVHVFDKWFATGLVKMNNDEEYLAAQVFAEFNRRSLIGQKAPSLVMESIDGDIVSVFGKDDAPGRFKILYFYDTACSKCRVESILLRNFLNSRNYPVDLYAIYAGDNRQAWEKYVSDNLSVSSATHLWDPTLDSDFQRKYGVLQTPRLLLAGPDGTILGRGLDVSALKDILDGIFAEKTIEYGTEESIALYDRIFAMSGGRPSEKEVRDIAEYISERTLERGDTLMFRQMAGDYLYYLASRAGEGYKEGLKYHLSRNILSDNGVWKSADDSVKVLGFARIMEDLLSKAAPGDDVPSIKVPGQLHTRKGSKPVNVRLDRIGAKVNIVIFYTEGCQVCASEKEAALKKLSQDRSMRVLMVNVDRIMEKEPALANRIMDAFDLSSLPFILITDRRGTVIRRYVSLLS